MLSDIKLGSWPAAAHKPDAILVSNEVYEAIEEGFAKQKTPLLSMDTLNGCFACFYTIDG